MSKKGIPPGNYARENSSEQRSIIGASTSVTAFVDYFRQGPLDQPVRITSFAEFDRIFGGLDHRSAASYGIQQYFLNGGKTAWVVRVLAEQHKTAALALKDSRQVFDGDLPPASPGDPDGRRWRSGSGATALIGSKARHTGMYALIDAAPFNLLCIPAAADLDQAAMVNVYLAALQLCLDQRAFLFVDIPAGVDRAGEMMDWIAICASAGLLSENAALYFPRLKVADGLMKRRRRDVASSGSLAGMFARIDASHGVWKAPAGVEASLQGVYLPAKISEAQSEVLSSQGVNILRNSPGYGIIAWGARTSVGADQQDSEWKYIPVRRTALFIETSVDQGLQWVVFEPGGEPPWQPIQLSVDAFMSGLFQRGAFQGDTQRDAYFVRCDRETTTQADLDNGILNIIVGFAPLRPAEFMVIKIQLEAGRPWSGNTTHNRG